MTFPADPCPATVLSQSQMWWRLPDATPYLGARVPEETGIRRFQAMNLRVCDETGFEGSRRCLGHPPGYPGIAAGGVLIALLSMAIEGSLGPKEALTIATYAVIMALVCMLACVVPARRALSVEPTEALRSDG